MSSSQGVPRFVQPCNYLNPNTRTEFLLAAGWTHALVSALDQIYTWKAPDNAVNYAFADFLVIGIKYGCALVASQGYQWRQHWLEFQTTFQQLHRDFSRVRVADAAFYVLEKNMGPELLTRHRKPTMEYFTSHEKDVIERLHEGEFSAHWMMIKQTINLQTLFKAIEVASLAEDDRECRICYEDLGSDTSNDRKCRKPEQPVKLPCGHVFGRRCMMTWLMDRTDEATCPTCRRVIYDEEYADRWNEDPGQQEVSHEIFDKAIEMLFSGQSDGQTP